MMMAALFFAHVHQEALSILHSLGALARAVRLCTKALRCRARTTIRRIPAGLNSSILRFLSFMAGSRGELGADPSKFVSDLDSLARRAGDMGRAFSSPNNWDCSSCDLLAHGIEVRRPVASVQSAV